METIYTTKNISLSKYTYFKDNILTCMNTLVGMYDLQLKVIPGFYNDLIICLYNNNCEIILNAISPYPKVGIVYDVYKIVDGYLSNIYEFKLFSNYGITQKEYHDYLTELDITINDPDDNDFAGYRRALIIAEKIILKYYMPIVNSSN